MEWIHQSSEFVKIIGGLTALLGPIFLLLYSYVNRRILTNKLDKLITISMMFILNIVLHFFYIIIMIYQHFYVDGEWVYYNDSMTMTLLITAIFTLFLGILSEMFFEMKIRLSFSLFKIDDISGLLLKQKVTESFRKVQYQVLDDKIEESKITKFYKKINREIGYPITEEYKEHNYFVSDVVNRLKNIRIIKGKFSLLFIVLLKWGLIISIGLIGLYKVPNYNNFWVCSILFVIAFITIMKNIICSVDINNHNEELIREEYEKFNKNNV